MYLRAALVSHEDRHFTVLCSETTGPILGHLSGRGAYLRTSLVLNPLRMALEFCIDGLRQLVDPLSVMFHITKA